jgi:hypothetical protein
MSFRQALPFLDAEGSTRTAPTLTIDTYSFLDHPLKVRFVLEEPALVQCWAIDSPSISLSLTATKESA